MRPLFFLLSTAAACFFAFFVLLFALFIFRAAVGGNLPPAKWCDVSHSTNSYPIPSPKTAMDYFENGNYNYDRGNCSAAIADYTSSVKLNPNYPEVYDNRAYTYMREENYAMALPDLDKAIQLRPNYVYALMNRGDIYNNYYNIDRQKALEDYNRVLAMGPAAYHDTALCGHRMLALENGWNIKVPIKMLLSFPNFRLAGCRN